MQKTTSDDMEKNPALARKMLARDMIEETKQVQKCLDELGEILEQLTKSDDPQVQVTGMKCKGQLKDMQAEFSQLKKLFRAQCKSMQLFEQGGG
jgi:ElaB/YqjD/DUF883 family membrane-anchored ribosome-binding protein